MSQKRSKNNILDISQKNLTQKDRIVLDIYDPKRESNVVKLLENARKDKSNFSSKRKIPQIPRRKQKAIKRENDERKEKEVTQRVKNKANQSKSNAYTSSRSNNEKRRSNHDDHSSNSESGSSDYENEDIVQENQRSRCKRQSSNQDNERSNDESGRLNGKKRMPNRESETALKFDSKLRSIEDQNINESGNGGRRMSNPVSETALKFESELRCIEDQTINETGNGGRRMSNPVSETALKFESELRCIEDQNINESGNGGRRMSNRDSETAKQFESKPPGKADHNINEHRKEAAKNVEGDTSTNLDLVEEDQEDVEEDEVADPDEYGGDQTDPDDAIDIDVIEQVKQVNNAINGSRDVMDSNPCSLDKKEITSLEQTKAQCKVKLSDKSKRKSDKTEENATDKKKRPVRQEKKANNAKPILDFRTAPQASLVEKNGDKYSLSNEGVMKMIEVGNNFTELSKKLEEQTQQLETCRDQFQQVEQKVEDVQRALGSCQMIWKIKDFKSKFAEAKAGEKAVLYSPSFETHPYGYRLAMSLVPNGDGSGAGKYMSIFFCILQGKFDHLLKWPFSHPLTFSLLDQSKSDDPAQDIHTRFVPNAIDKNRVFLDKPATYRNPSLGLPKFAPLSEVWKDDGQRYVKDDTLFIRVQVKVTPPEEVVSIVTEGELEPDLSRE